MVKADEIGGTKSGMGGVAFGSFEGGEDEVVEEDRVKNCERSET